MRGVKAWSMNGGSWSFGARLRLDNLPEACSAQQLIVDSDVRFNVTR